MAEFSPEEQRDLIEAAKSRDQRIALIERALDVQVEFRDSPTWRLFQENIDREKADVLAEFADASPADLPTIARLQARAMAVFAMHRWIGGLIVDAQVAEEAIARNDGRLPADE